MSKIEIIIDKENNGTDVSLSSLSVNSTNALIEILTAFRNIAVHEGKSDIKIGLVEGSACAILEANNDTLEDIHTSIMKVVHNEPSRDNFYVTNLQVIKDQIIDRGLNIEVKYFNQNQETSIRNIFDSTFRKKRDRKAIENNFNIEFFNAELLENGGSKPNFHVISNGQKFKISCEKEEAQKVNSFLYKKVRFSAWAKMGSNNKMQYTYCDIYEGSTRDFYTEFKMFFSELNQLQGTEKIKKIHYKLKEFYSNGEFAEARKFIRIFINSEATVSSLMSILIISKRFKNHEQLQDLLLDVEQLLVSKTKKPVL